jgi:hypothetical protein
MECEIMVLYETALGKDMIEEIPALHKISLLRLWIRVQWNGVCRLLVLKHAGLLNV